MPERIAIVSSSFPPESSGGVSHAQYNLARALEAKGFDVRVFTFGDRPGASGAPNIVRKGVPPLVSRFFERLIGLYFRCKDPSTIAYHFAEVVIFAWSSIKLNRIIGKFRPDVLILPDHGCPGLCIRKPPGCRTILVSHHNPARFLENPLWGRHSQLDVKLTIAAENRALRKIDAVICPSHYMHEMFRRTYEFSGPVSVVPNMIDTGMLSSITMHDIRETLGLRPEAVLVYIPSAGSVYKGSQYVCEIIRRLAALTSGDIGFYLSGPISQAMAFELNSRPHNAKVHMPGQISYRDNLAIVKACSFGLSPTLIENFSMALLEAHACGVPMAAFDVGGNAEIIVNGRSGLLVPYLDVEALVRAGDRLLDKSYRTAMGIEAMRNAASRFSSQVVIEQVAALIEKAGR
ncbi:hypothetical protein W02_16080 [Nitrospira sp. KM1]|uniref:glycosyltransferase family 4 protein n=1 Tax=Nitrospira sp. KM1 TaxID=1936990 RepID=UPI0013A71A4E|nr:glycosyltransferase family 4 protein [Nitrospira sp. KM1]BCA54468.1 hypothetical protein W02_16080 [Nitrospira sp. KM1]